MAQMSLRRCLLVGILICFLASVFLGFHLIWKHSVENSLDMENHEVVWVKRGDNATLILAKNALLSKMLQFRAKKLHRHKANQQMGDLKLQRTLTKKMTRLPSSKNQTSSLGLMKDNVHIFYYLWYGNPRVDGKYFHWNHHVLPHWTDRKKMVRIHFPPLDIGSNFYPELGPYSSADPMVMQIHMQQIRSTGVGVIAVSWYPPDMADAEGMPPDRLIQKLLDAAEEHGIKVAFHIEPYKGRNHTTFRRDVMYIIRDYGSHPAFYRHFHKGRHLPLFYVYDSYQTPMNLWKQIFQPGEALSLRNSRYDAIFIGLLIEQKDRQLLLASGFDGFYTYFGTNGFTYGSTWNYWHELSRFAQQHRLIFIPSVSPGYIDLQIRPWNSENTRDREQGEYYDKAFQMALNSNPSMLSITSFNEWHEGTQIEPAVPQNVGTFIYFSYLPHDSNFYLKQTRKWIKRFG